MLYVFTKHVVLIRCLVCIETRSNAIRSHAALMIKVQMQTMLLRNLGCVHYCFAHQQVHVPGRVVNEHHLASLRGVLDRLYGITKASYPSGVVVHATLARILLYC